MMQMPAITEKGIRRVFRRHGELPRFMFCVGLATYLSVMINTDEAALAALTPKQAGIIEGCCNFMQYLKGAGHKAPRLSCVEILVRRLVTTKI